MLAWRWKYVAEYIEREALLREMLNSGRAAYLVVMDAPAVNLKSLRPTWRDPDKDPPKVETEVLVLYRYNGYMGITTAHYEDGNVFSQDSEWNWEDLPDWGTYDEERDDYRIPEGWWESAEALLQAACMNKASTEKYLQGRNGYCWHISDLKIYDRPRPLSDFTRLRATKFGYEPVDVERPPQSWFYVEDAECTS